MKNQVLKILQKTPEAYEQLVMDTYFDWCSRQARNHRQLQKLLTCIPLFNWWYACLGIKERQFVSDALDYAGKITPELAEDYYKESIGGIYKLFSKPLIKQAYDS